MATICVVWHFVDGSLRSLIGDEAAFKLNGEVNTWNVRRYAEHGFTYDVPNSRENVTVWVGLVDNNVIGPYFHDANVNGKNYLDMINNQVVPELHRLYGRTRVGDVPRIWWVQDGAPAHRRDRLDVLFLTMLFGLGHAREWPRRSPDLTPLGFFLWVYPRSTKLYHVI